MYGYDSFNCPIDKAVVRDRIIKFYCSYLGFADINLLNHFHFIVERYSKYNPHLAFQFHESCP